jgi:hypothetical protein
MLAGDTSTAFVVFFGLFGFGLAEPMDCAPTH